MCGLSVLSCNLNAKLYLFVLIKEWIHIEEVRGSDRWLVYVSWKIAACCCFGEREMDKMDNVRDLKC